jgi:hypothetical protein
MRIGESWLGCALVATIGVGSSKQLLLLLADEVKHGDAIHRAQTLPPKACEEEVYPVQDSPGQGDQGRCLPPPPLLAIWQDHQAQQMR